MPAKGAWTTGRRISPTRAEKAMIPTTAQVAAFDQRRSCWCGASVISASREPVDHRARGGAVEELQDREAVGGEHQERQEPVPLGEAVEDRRRPAHRMRRQSV